MSSSITDDDYFKDVTNQITEKDRVKAGYRVPQKKISVKDFLGQNVPEETQKKIDEKLERVSENFHINTNQGTVSVGPPKPIDTKTLRGDLTNVAVPIPINFHEGGMFNDEKDRQSYDKPFNFRKMPTKKETNDQLLIEEANDDEKEQTQLINRNESTQLVNRTETPTSPNNDHRLIGQSTNNPYQSEALVTRPGSLTKAHVGEDALIIGRGPNNSYGRSGYYGGLFNAGRFGNYPSESHELHYNADDIDQTDENGCYIDNIKNTRQEQLCIDQIEYNRKLLDQNIDGKSITYTGSSLEKSIENTAYQLLTNKQEHSGLIEHPEQSTDSKIKIDHLDDISESSTESDHDIDYYIDNNETIMELKETVVEQNQKIDKLKELVELQSKNIEELTTLIKNLTENQQDEEKKDVNEKNQQDEEKEDADKKREEEEEERAEAEASLLAVFFLKLVRYMKIY